MEARSGTPREIAVPVSVFGTLRSELEKEAGTLPTVHALHHAGYKAGAEAAASFSETGRLRAEAFWARLADFFAQRGWGTVTHSQMHAAIGMLESADWAESTDVEVDPEASCCFSTGFLSGLLSRLANGPVAVLEVECRTRGGGSCRFAFGSEGAIHDLYGRLVEGADLDGALAAL